MAIKRMFISFDAQFKGVIVGSRQLIGRQTTLFAFNFIKHLLKWAQSHPNHTKLTSFVISSFLMTYYKFRVICDRSEWVKMWGLFGKRKGIYIRII